MNIEEITAIQNLKIVLSLESGRIFFKHLLKELDILGSPPPLLTPEQMIEETAYRRFGGTIINYITKADPLVLGQLMAEIGKEKQNVWIEENKPINESNDRDF